VWPLDHPETSLRDCCKQLLLVEHHCQTPGRLCPSCIQKHLLTAIALAEEAVSLSAGHPRYMHSLCLVQGLEGVYWSDLYELARQTRAVRSALLVCDYYSLAA
jgi:hypothetical protein